MQAVTNFGLQKLYKTMAAELQESPNADLERPEALDALFQTISRTRLTPYMAQAGHDPVRALNLYLWNAQVGEAFHIPIQSLEVALRNKIDAALSDTFGAEWWKAPEFGSIADIERKQDIEQVLTRIRNRNQELCTDQVVATLSFGFWAGMLQPKYNPPIWGAQLRKRFPDLPQNRSRKSLAKNVGQIVTLRNRIWHHEPIFKRNLLRDYQITMTTLEWVCPAKAAWIRPHCRVIELLQRKP